MSQTRKALIIGIVFVLPVVAGCGPASAETPAAETAEPSALSEGVGEDNDGIDTSSEPLSEPSQIEQTFATELQSPFSEVPIPADAEIDTVGQNGFSFSTGASILDLAFFYKEDMAELGWQEVPGKVLFLMEQLYQNEFSRGDTVIALRAENQQGTVTVTIVTQ